MTRPFWPFIGVLALLAAGFGVAGLPWQIPAALAIICSLAIREERACAQAGTFAVLGTAFIEAGFCCFGWAGGAAINALTLS